MCGKLNRDYTVKQPQVSKSITSDFAPELKISSLHFNGTQTASRGKCLAMGSQYGLLSISRMIGDVDGVLAPPISDYEQRQVRLLDRS